MTTQNFEEATAPQSLTFATIEELTKALESLKDDQLALVGYVDENGDCQHLTREVLNQSFARKVVEEGQKINDEYSRRHEYPTAPLLELLDRIRFLSGLSGSYSDRVAGEDNQHKE